MLRLYDYFYYKAGSNANRRTRDPAHCAASVEAAGKKIGVARYPLRPRPLQS